MSNPYLIGIAGPSCSGKSEVATRLARILRAPTLALDHYYRDLTHIPFEERVRTNFDSPDAVDEELILQHVRALQKGESVAQPTYDFAQHVRSPETHQIPSAPFVLIEGLFCLCWPRLRDLLDLRIYIDAEHEVCLARRVFRDVRERGRTEESVREQYAATVQPMCECHITPSKAHADLVLSGVAPVKESVYTILKFIAERLGEGAFDMMPPNETA